jgi:D-xylose transport system substrate-binding protein
MRKRSRLIRFLVVAIVAGLVLALAGCATSTTTSGTTGTATSTAGGGGVKIALLLPESKTARY